MGRAAIVMLLVFAGASLAAAGDDGKVKEPVTGVSFAAVDPDGLGLLGVGVRKKLVFNVYAGALYVEVAAMAAGLESLAEEKLFHAVIHGEFKKRIVMHFVRDVGADRVRDNFAESLRNNMTEEDYAAEKEDMERFLAAVKEVKEGEEFELVTRGREIRVKQGGALLFEASSVRLARGMWACWFGKKPVDETLRGALVSRAAELFPGMKGE